MKQEREFWRRIAGDLNPQWQVELGRKWTPERGSVSGNDFCIYAVDVKTGWMGCGALPQSEFERLMVEAPRSGVTAATAHDAAAQLICEAADSSMQAGDADYESTMLLAALGLTETKTFEMGRKHNGGSMEGHWLYVVYRTGKGEYVGRPAMMQTRTPGLAPPDVIKAYVRKIVQADMGQPTSMVGTMLRQAGGAAVWEGFR